MAKFDVFKNPDGNGLLLEVQSDLLDALNTRIVVPLFVASKAPKPAKKLNPTFNIEGKKYVMVTQFLAAVPSSLLKRPITNLDEQFSEISDALDLLITGF